MKFPENDQYWVAVANFLSTNCKPDSKLFGPREFLQKFQNLYGYGCGHAFQISEFDYFVIHKGMTDCLTRDFLVAIQAQHLSPVFSNEVFVVLAKDTHNELDGSSHYTSLLETVDRELYLRRGERTLSQAAIVVTTFNRPWALTRSLPQVARLGAPVLVVDDGSTAPNSGENRLICEEHGVKYLCLPENRGIAGAINLGVDYWLVDPAIQWISYHQDDTDVRADLLSLLIPLGDALERPILTGRKPMEFEDYGSVLLKEQEVLLYRDCPGLHLLAHRDYWQSVLPIPSPYLGAPKPGAGLGEMGPEEDHWVTAWSPNSIAKRGGYVHCLPGLVRTFSESANQSSWGKAAQYIDPPLKAD